MIRGNPMPKSSSRIGNCSNACRRSNPRAERASTSSIDGFVKLALKQMTEYGLVRLERDSEDEAQALYTATHRLRVHLRELTLPRLFHLTRAALAH